MFAKKNGEKKRCWKGIIPDGLVTTVYVPRKMSHG